MSDFIFCIASIFRLFDVPPCKSDKVFNRMGLPANICLSHHSHAISLNLLQHFFLRTNSFSHYLVGTSLCAIFSIILNI